MAKPPLPCPTIIRLVLDYNPGTGLFRHRHIPEWAFQTPGAAKARNTRFAGQPASYVGRNGYFYISVRQHRLLAHRLAWVCFYGVWPRGDLDHINGNPTDNRIANLRDVSRSENLRNQKRRADNTSGATGVYFDKRRNGWYAKAANRGTGCFATKEEAILARQRLSEEMGFTDRHGT